MRHLSDLLRDPGEAPVAWIETQWLPDEDTIHTHSVEIPVHAEPAPQPALGRPEESLLSRGDLRAYRRGRARQRLEVILSTAAIIACAVLVLGIVTLLGFVVLTPSAD